MSTSDAASVSHDGQKLASFEGLRGVLALTVCIGHIGLNTVTERFGFHVRFELAVTMFFTLSGFVLARSYYFQRRTFWRLFSGRVARLYPLHLLTFLWCVSLAVLERKSLDPPLIFQNIFLLQNIGLHPNRWEFNVPSWSISVEMLASLLFYFVLLRRRAVLLPALVIAGIAGSALAAASGLDPAQNYLSVINIGVLQGTSGFCLGSAAYLATLNPPPIFTRLRWLTPVLFLAVALFFVLPNWSWVAGGLFALCSVLAVTFSAINDDATFLSSRPFVYLGAISYSIYLLHIPVLITAVYLFSDDRSRGLVAKSLLVLAVLLISAICHRYFELPMQRLLLYCMADRNLARSQRTSNFV